MILIYFLLGLGVVLLLHLLLRGGRVSEKNKMSEFEARQILGVGTEANEEEIHAAWRALMQKNHPDQGGSEYLARQINHAREVLLKK